MVPLLPTLARGARRLCPACGRAPIFSRWNEVRERCPACGYPLGEREADTWLFTYVSAAAITGVFLAIMFLAPPSNEHRWRLVITVAAAAAYVASLWARKGVAFAILYYLERRFHSSEERH